MSKIEKYQKNRLRSSYIYVVLSIALVLFVLGLLGIVVLQTKVLAKHFKEQVTMSVFLYDHTDAGIIKDFQADLKKRNYIKTVSFISKDEAAKLLSKDLGEDFVIFLGTNPLKDNIQLQLNSEFVTKDSVAKIRKELSQNKAVYEIDYNEILIDKLDRNIQKITFWILILSSILTLIAVILINSTIRLSIFSKRFTIKTMQMVGATKGFIRKPFIITGVKLGLLGALLANIGLFVLILYFEKQSPELNMVKQWNVLLLVFGGVFLIGIIITGISTFFATRRFLNLRTEELYY
jgi:cell division transport system permease protein